MRRLIALLIIFAAPAAADESCSIVRQAYAPTENLETIDGELLGRATKTIDMAAYVLTSIPIVEALDRAASRGVRVRLYRDGADVRLPRALADAYDRLAARKNVEIRYKPAPAPLMHLKSYVIDGQILRDGSGNFSHGGLLRQDNSLVALRCPGVVRQFERVFEQMWRR
ncbi:MAG: phospholipase D-like domain-containing protein [Methylocystis sp.]